MTSAGLALCVALLAIGGAATASLPSVELRFEERVLAAVVLAILVGTAAIYLLALVVGLSATSVVGGAAIFAAVPLTLATLRRRHVAKRWTQEWRELLHPGRRRHLMALLAVLAGSAAVFGVIFAHTLFTDSAGNLDSTYATVWADWAEHLTTASSFALAHNMPAVNPLFSGHALRYPFFPDFESATLETLGVAPALALALPGALLMVCITLLVVTLAVRLGAGAAAGAVAALILVIGGGLGFVGALSDACQAHGFSAAQCSLSGLVTHPLDIPGVVAGTLRALPGIVAAQPRAYDGLQTSAAQMSLPNQQWYTPLLAWWLPQRSLLYGFAGALVVFTLVLAAVRSEGRHLQTWAVAAVLLGLMPFIHIHTLLAVAAILSVFAVSARRAGWLVLAGITAAIATPRLLTLVNGPHGSAAFGNVFPTVEPGWMYLGGGGARPPLTPASLVSGIAGYVRALVSPEYWGFWIANTAFLLPACVIVALAALWGRVRGAPALLARRVGAAVPTDLLRFVLGGLLLFAVANVVIFQSWDWDNTKLLVYWYLSAALLAGTLVVRLARHRWSAAAAVGLGATAVLTGVLVLLRFLPWTPAVDAAGGPYALVTAADIRLAHAVAASTPSDAVFLTEGRPNDPVTTVAGRTVVMGYYGWLWSYGTDFGSRYADVRTMLEGCPGSMASSTCAVSGLLKRYHVGFVEIDDRLNSPGVVDPGTNVAWWASQSLPVIARDGDVTVYDVRGQ
ncbi:MAG: hypothetical protein ACYDAC_01310 [Candidatus Dormibacteria bacterium]